MEHNKPTQRYSKDQQIARHKGNWVEKYAVSQCSEIGKACVYVASIECLSYGYLSPVLAVGEHDDTLVDLLLRDNDPSNDTAVHLHGVETFCEGSLGVCLAEERELLGDWDGDEKVRRFFPTVTLPKDYL